MFVSSYSTYISTNNIQKTSTDKSESQNTPKISFESKLLQNTVLESSNTKKFPINYISNYKTFSNKQKLEDSFENKIKDKYNKNKAVKNAQDAYADNSKIFSFLLEPKMTQNQTPMLNTTLPNNIQMLQEQKMRHKMVNTYISNDKYYQITA
ncbi:hypothetical protein [Sulfurimonas sp.]|uniref:hypothetical protein n=1 Tax=Sulfurimonas sp. TaxID=2022749 RepID=UPI002AB0F338|nr:hypothetical protein [Sulfurimonas sp.]